MKGRSVGRYGTLSFRAGELRGWGIKHSHVIRGVCVFGLSENPCCVQVGGGGAYFEVCKSLPLIFESKKSTFC